MRLKQFLLLLSALFVLEVALAQTETTWLGYKPVSELNSSQVPQRLLDFASNSVVKFGSYSGSNTRFEIVEVDPNGPQATIESLSRSFRANAIETCRIQGIRKCPVYPVSVGEQIRNSGTMFLNNGRFMACRHNFIGWIKKVVELNPGTSIIGLITPLSVSINSQTVYLSGSGFATLEQQFKIKKINENLRFEIDQGDVDYFVDDYIELETSFQPLIDVLKDYGFRENRRVSDIPKNTRSFLFGYPGPTTEFGGVNNGDSPGGILVASVGLEIKPSLSGELATFVSSTSAFSSAGASGAPVLDSDGNILGISCSGNSRSTSFISVHPDTVDESWSH